MFCEKHIQTIQKKKRAGIRKLYGGLIATGAVISTISLLFDLVFYVARKKEIYEVLRWNLSRGFSAKHNVSENSVQNICRAVSPQRMRIIGSMVFFYL